MGLAGFIAGFGAAVCEPERPVLARAVVRRFVEVEVVVVDTGSGSGGTHALNVKPVDGIGDGEV